MNEDAYLKLLKARADLDQSVVLAALNAPSTVSIGELVQLIIRLRGIANAAEVVLKNAGGVKAAQRAIMELNELEDALMVLHGGTDDE